MTKTIDLQRPEDTMRLRSMMVSLMLLALSFAYGDRSMAIVSDAMSGECEQLPAGLERPLIAAAAAALEPNDRWERPRNVCVRGKGTLAIVKLDAVQSPDVGIRHDVRCARASTSAAWACNKLRSDFVLQLKEREVTVDPHVAMSDARKVAHFFVGYTGPGFKLANCGRESNSLFTGETLKNLEIVYLDPDSGLTVSLGDRRITLDSNALKAGEVKPVCWWRMAW